METYNINGVEIQYDTFDLVNLERSLKLENV